MQTASEFDTPFTNLKSSSTDFTALTAELKQLHQNPDEYWYAMGSRLQIILNERLYRMGGYRSFSDYCARGLGYSRQHVYKLLQVVKFIDNCWTQAVATEQRALVRRLFRLGITRLYLLQSLPHNLIIQLLNEGVPIFTRDNDVQQINQLEEVTISQLKRALVNNQHSEKRRANYYAKPAVTNKLTTFIGMQARTLLQLVEQCQLLVQNQDELKDHLEMIKEFTNIIFDSVSVMAGDNRSKEYLAREAEVVEGMEAADRIKDDFLAMVSHELRTPLTAIMGWVKLLRSSKLDDESAERAFEIIEHNAQVQTQLVNDLLDISSMVKGKLRMKISPVDLVATINAAIDSIRPHADANTITIESMLDSSIGSITGDPERLQQVVSNLLSNAIQFTPPGGSVKVQLDQVDNYARIIVKDSGKGISAELLPHIFERFKQADNNNAKTYRGLGLGLTIVQHIVELHAGKVAAESEGEGLGATFTVQLLKSICPDRSMLACVEQFEELQG